MCSNNDKASNRGGSQIKHEKGSESDGTLQRHGPAAVDATGSKAPARRGFLAGVGVAGVAGAAALATARNTTPGAAETADQAPSPRPTAGRGYSETDHVRRYYDTTRV